MSVGYQASGSTVWINCCRSMTILILKRTTLAKFSYRALRGLAPISDGDTIKGMLLALASMDSKALRDVAKLNEDLTTVLTSNMYGQNLKTAELKTSELRTYFL